MTEKDSPKFTHLHVHSHYSLLDGLSKIDNLLDYAKELGMTSIALTDHGNLYGAIEFYQKAKKRNIKPIIGIEGYVSNNRMTDKRPGIDDKRFHIILLAKNNTGYKNLIALTTKAHLEGYYYKPRFDKELLRTHSKGILALSGCLGSEIPQLILAKKIDEAKKTILEYQDIFGKDNFYLEVQHHPNLKEQGRVNDALFKLSSQMHVPVVATQDSHYLKSEDAEAHDILLAIQTGNTVDDKNRLTLIDDDFSLKSPAQMARHFQGHPEAIKNTKKIADMCNVEIELGKTQLPKFDVPKGYTESSYLKKLCYLGLNEYYGKNPSKEVIDRLNYELSVIDKTGFSSYMLIVYDFVHWAKKQGIIVGPGRGSAAGSIVSYLLNITKIDPIEFNLLFERFLNPDRISMPDIDLDFADTRRDEVLEYVSKKYGKNKVAQIITFGTMAARAVIRDVGRALGYSYGYCDKIAKLIPPINYSLTRAMREISELKELYINDPAAKKLIDNAKKLEGVARHASVHACGVVITEQPLINIVPLQHSTSQAEKSMITQFEMHAIEDLGLLKMDFLGLKNLTIIEDTLKEIERRYAKKIDIDNIPIDDEKTYKLLQKANTTGVFQLESDGMRRYLKDLKPTEFEDIIAMVALYRPGPIELIPSFIKRKHGEEVVTYLHPKLEPILKNTYGIGIYQEQMMKIATDLAKYTLPEADILRKAIGKKIKSLLDAQQEKLITGMIKNGIDPAIAEKIWNLFPPFARYGFPRAHAASYARIAYETAYLKTHYPTEFIASLLNAEQKNIDRISFIINEASKMNIKLLPPSINESGEKFTVINDNAIRFGLAAIKNVGSNVVHAIIEERNKNGKYKTVETMLERIIESGLNKKSFESLIKTGAMDELGERNKLFINIDNLLQYSREHQKIQNSGQFSLFGAETGITSKLTLKKVAAATDKEKLAWEKELLGFYISSHPLKEFASKLTHVTNINMLSPDTYSSVKVGAIINTTKKILTRSGEPMMFISLEDLTGKIEALVFPRLFKKKQDILEENKIIIVRGKISTKDGDLKLLCDDIIELT